MRRLTMSLLTIGLAFAATDVGAAKLKGGVLGNGGTPVAGSTAAGKHLRGTCGQAVVGVSGGSGRVLCHGYWCLGGVTVLSVFEDPPGSRLPAQLAFGLPTPNPAIGSVNFALALPAAAEVDVGLFDVAGRRAGTLVSTRLEAGNYQVHWDGTDADGRPVRAGVFYARLIVDGRTVAKRTVVMRH